MNSSPKPASTVVLMDHFSRVYMTKRPQTMKFMAGYYVFPGGAVDPFDSIQAGEPFIHGNCHTHISLDHYVAAARELFEEVGVLVCTKADGSHVQLAEEASIEHRRRLLNGELTFLQLLQKEDLHFKLDCLSYIGHIITPNRSRIRFDTRFFLTQLPQGQTPTPDEHEISEARWITPANALAAYRRGEITLAPPTIHTLKTLINYQTGGQLLMPDFQIDDYLAD